MKDAKLATLIAKLEHGAASEFSVYIRPGECKDLLAELRRPPSRRKVNQ